MIIAGRVWAVVTVAVAVVAVLVELVLVIMGVSIGDDDVLAPLGIRLWRFVSYFTIQSNVLVIITVAALIMDPARDGARWRVLRLDGLIMITITGLVHWFLLRPLARLTGWSAVADTLLHLVVPGLTVVGWLVFGPRPRIAGKTVGWSLLWPLGWLAYTFVVGAVTGWVPYPFLDVAEQGLGQVAITCGAMTLLFTGLAWAAARLDRVLPRAGLSVPAARIEP